MAENKEQSNQSLDKNENLLIVQMICSSQDLLGSEYTINLKTVCSKKSQDS